MHKAYKFRIRETPSLRQAFVRHAGAARWAWNWGLARQLQHYEKTGEYLSLSELDKEFTAVRAATPWLRSVPCPLGRDCPTRKGVRARPVHLPDSAVMAAHERRAQRHVDGGGPDD